MVMMPIKTVSVLNGSQGNWRAATERRRRQRSDAFVLCPKASLPCTVTMTRLSAGTPDDDNLRSALKSVRDGIADRLGIDDRDPRVSWAYAQEKCSRGKFGVRVEFESKEGI